VYARGATLIRRLAADETPTLGAARSQNEQASLTLWYGLPATIQEAPANDTLTKITVVFPA